MNRLLGTLFAVAALVVIAFAILNYGNYTSMRSTSAPASVDAVVSEEIETIVDTTLVEPADSLATEEVAPPVDM